VGKRDGYFGHKTMVDGTHVPLTEGEADALWKRVEELKAKRQADMPTAEDALRVMIEARQRMNELGWWLGGGLRVRKGDECAISETGSTGIWRGYVDAEGEYAHYSDCVSRPRDVWLKPLADLTPEERARMEACDKDAAEYQRAMFSRFAAAEQDPS
jgi:hypothetical protein